MLRQIQVSPIVSFIPSYRCTLLRCVHGDAQASKSSIHVRWMRVALAQARNASVRGEVPVGAVLVDSAGNELSRAANAVESSNDPSMHAEIAAIRLASAKRNGWRLNGATLYSTLEPCPMCLSAAALARIDYIVYGAKDIRLGACGSWLDLTKERHPFHSFSDICGGVLAEESAQLMQDFFRKRREETAKKKQASIAEIMNEAPG